MVGMRQLKYWLIGGICSFVLGIGIMSLGYLSLPLGLEEFFALPIILAYRLGYVGYVLGLVLFFIPGALLGSVAYFLPHRWQRVSLLLFIVLLAAASYGWAYSENRAQADKIFNRGYSPTDCDRLGDESEIGNCYANIYSTLPPDPQICKKILLKSDKESRLYECASYVGEKSGNAELCKEFGENTVLIETCLAGTALYAGSVAVCSTILNQSEKNYCYHSAAVKSQNISLCDNITGETTIFPSRVYCRGTILYDQTLTCNQEKGKEAQYQCLHSICAPLQEPKLQADCYANAVFRTKDKLFCDSITDSSFRNACQELRRSDFSVGIFMGL